MERFNYETNGYNRSEVNYFVNDVISKLEIILNSLKQKEIEIEQLKKELNHFRNIDKISELSIKKYEEIGISIKNIAKEESELIISNAKNNASKIINDALIRAEEIEKRNELLEKNIRTFKRKLRLIIDEQNSVIDEIDKLELEK